MHELTERGRQIVEELAQRYGVSSGAVMAMLQSLVAGGGTMAQFSHPEFGGLGQWTHGGMTMVGDMFNNALKAKVDDLCSELSRLLTSEPVLARQASKQSQSQSQGGLANALGDVSLFVSSGRAVGAWWPADLGTPASTGTQNNLRYAYFPAARRLAIDVGGKMTIYDTLDHRIAGVSQQQSGDASFTFVSQHGLVRVADLPVVSDTDARSSPPPPPASAPSRPNADVGVAEPTPGQPASAAPHRASPGARQSDDIFANIERLAELHAKGILSDEEYIAKKTELLGRL